MKTWASYLLIFLFAAKAWPCANFSSGRGRVLPLRIAMRTDLETQGAEIEEKLHGAKGFNQRNDYAVALMYLGRSKEAVDLLQQLEKEKPGEYMVAANLGTALELSGDDESAKHWIEEGIHRNPKSHEGTEWLHLKILEAKIAARKNASYFNNNTILNLRAADLGREVDIGSQRIPIKDVAKAFDYQLQERMKFVKPKDAVVAGLLFDFAAVEAVTGTLEAANSILSLAEEYGFPKSKVDPVRADFARRMWWSSVVSWSLILAAFGGILAFCYKKGWFVLSSRDLKKRSERKAA